MQNLVDDEDKPDLLAFSFKHFRETMLYEKDKTSLQDVKNALETKQKINDDIVGQSSNSQAQGPYARVEKVP